MFRKINPKTRISIELIRTHPFRRNHPYHVRNHLYSARFDSPIDRRRCSWLLSIQRRKTISFDLNDVDHYRSFYEFLGISSCDSDFTLRFPASGDSNLNCGNNRSRIFISSHFSLGISDSHTTCKNRLFFQSRFCNRFDSLPFKSLGLNLSQIRFGILSDHKKRETNFNFTAK